MSSGKDEIYCFDSSAFIALNRAHNTIPVPDLWKELDKLFKAGKIISHELVFDEIHPGRKSPDFLEKWIGDKKGYFIGITEKQSEVVTAILNSYPTLIDYKKERNEADPWLIALAVEKAEEVTLFEKSTLIYVISQEKITSTTKIPAVCRQFKIPHMNLEQFYKDNNWKFGIIK